MNDSSKAMTIVLCGLFLGACTTSNSARQLANLDPNDLLLDEHFVSDGQSLPSIEHPDLFSLPASYQEELDRIIASEDSEYVRYRKLRRWIYRRFEDYDFDVTETYSLGQLNTNRKINCLSFSVLFVAAARYIDVPASFQLVLAPPYWDREDNNWINNQHINVFGTVALDDEVPEISIDNQYFDHLLVRTARVTNGFRLVELQKPSRRYTADINPAVYSISSGRERIDERQVLSLFFSNKAIEALLDKDVSIAYAYTKQALMADPESSIA